MANRPSKFPDWATVPQQDPVYHVDNIVEPPDAKKEKGWEYKEYPPSNWMNWLHSLGNEWLKYLDEKIQQLSSSTPTPLGGIIDFPAPNAPVPAGFLFLNHSTVGALGSTATYKGDIYYNFFLHLWNGYSNISCPVLPSRGASAIDDWNANKSITLPYNIYEDRALAGATGGTRGNLETAGTNSTIITTANLPTIQTSHTASVSRGADAGNRTQPFWGGGDRQDGTATGYPTFYGSSQPMSIMQLTVFIRKIICYKGV